MPSKLPKSTRVLLAFASVYLFWGSTYLAIHVAGEHMSVPVVSASRSTASAVIITLICLFSRRSLRVPRGEPWKLILVGLLFMSANNMLLTWGEKMVPSGFASLIISTMPIMIALLNGALPGGDPMNRRGWTGTFLGSVGIAVLVWPSLHRHVSSPGASHPLLGVLVLLGAALSFAVGSVLSRRFHFRADTLVATGWQIGAAGLFNWLVAFASGGLHRTVWTWHGVEAILYLSIFGSIFGLVAFTYLLQNVAVTKVATYAFVNPVIAVLLGVLLLHERLAGAEIAGMVVILGAVVMVVYSRVNRVPRTLAAGVGDPTE
ncbi:MAG TPA: EamA family transporter [Acidobacteriaceae bacterium]|jgi:drug/metabolite transporter (DMT)-like permease|nr:EamA family transporter [Acidobacteriaceae bacterium]